MPYKSDAQRRYMNWAASQGKLPQKVATEFNQASKGLKLPEKVRFTKIKDKLRKP